MYNSLRAGKEGRGELQFSKEKQWSTDRKPNHEELSPTTLAPRLGSPLGLGSCELRAGLGLVQWLLCASPGAWGGSRS